MTCLEDLVIERCSEIRAPISIADPARNDCPLIHVNERFEALTGFADADVTGRNCRILQGRDTDPSAVQSIREAIGALQPITKCIVNYRRDGSSSLNLLSIQPFEAEPDRWLILGFQCAFDRTRTLDRIMTDADAVETTINRRANSKDRALQMQTVAARQQAEAAVMNVKTYLMMSRHHPVF